MVNRLLASDAYTERILWYGWTQQGTEYIRFRHGPRDMWPWRDWVLMRTKKHAFDQFSIEQLADLLPNPTDDQKIASGFNRNQTPMRGVIAEEFRVEYVVDR